MEKNFSLNGMKFVINGEVISDFGDDGDSMSMSDVVEHNVNNTIDPMSFIDIKNKQDVPMAPGIPKDMELTIKPSINNKHLDIFKKYVHEVVKNPSMEFKMHIANQEHMATRFGHCRMLRSSISSFFNPEPPFYVFSFREMMEGKE